MTFPWCLHSCTIHWIPQLCNAAFSFCLHACDLSCFIAFFWCLIQNVQDFFRIIKKKRLVTSWLLINSLQSIDHCLFVLDWVEQCYHIESKHNYTTELNWLCMLDWYQRIPSIRRTPTFSIFFPACKRAIGRSWWKHNPLSPGQWTDLKEETHSVITLTISLRT